MPRGSKSKYTDKQKRQAEHIEEGYRKEGVSKKTAEARAWATVNKQDGGGKKGASGTRNSSTRRKRSTRSSSPRTTTARKRTPRAGKKATSRSR